MYIDEGDSAMGAAFAETVTPNFVAATIQLDAIKIC